MSTCLQDIFWLMSFPISDASTREIAVQYPLRFVPEEAPARRTRADE